MVVCINVVKTSIGTEAKRDTSLRKDNEFDEKAGCRIRI